MEFDKIVETIKKIIRSAGSGQERLKRIWDFLEVVEKEKKNGSPS